MKRLSIICIYMVLSAMGVNAQGIQFFEESFEQALKLAQDQNKRVFVDFYATWCGPCKVMSKDVFTNAAVGDYFNQKFVSIKLNAEQAELKTIVDKYGVKAYPTLVLLNASGEVISSIEGSMSADQFLKWAKAALNETVSYEKLYEQLKSNKNNTALIRELLLGAADFVASQQGTNRERWVLRVERLYADYRKQKPLPEFMNTQDFEVLMMYHTEPVKEDIVVEYIMANYDDVVASVGEDKVNQYIFSMNTLLIQDLAQKGDMDYEKYLERIRGDMKPIYQAMMKSEPYMVMKYLNDGIYYIYNRKNVDKYLSLMDEYLIKIGDNVTSKDYSSAIQTMYEALDGKLPANASTKGVEWITKALHQENIEVDERMELLIMMGDCYKLLTDTANAKKCFNQAYVLSLQFNNPGLSAQVQAMMTDL